MKPDYQGAKTCTYTAKKHGGVAESKEAIQKKFDNLKKARQERWSNRDRSLFYGTHNLAYVEIVPGEGMPRWGDILISEESQDGHEE